MHPHGLQCRTGQAQLLKRTQVFPGLLVWIARQLLSLCGRKTLLTARRKERLQKLVERQPDATLAELGGQLDRVFGTSTVDVWLRRMGLSCKKNAAHRRAVAARRGRTTKALASTAR